MLSELRNYAELMRVANVFTAVSNVWMGMILATGHLPGGTAVGITLTSALLYLAGMVLNDVFDHELDAVQRPERPIPSDRVSLAAARTLGWGLLFGGMATGWATAFLTENYATGIMTTLLAGVVLSYDGFAKKTFLSPAVMACCRTFNVMLGMSLAVVYTGSGNFAFEASPIPALGIGVYILGVTYFARTEASMSSRLQLTLSSLCSTAGLALLAAMPWLAVPDDPPLQIQPFGWIILWIVVAGTILRRMAVGIMQPTPKFVQRAVGHAILSIIVIDAALCLGYAGPFWALAVLSLLAPAMLLAQFLKVT